ncbi:hypothetical protein [Sellimonas sp.]|uniref:hypothetical protein n=1 Tax=Sellimonas sp. TaxID=2021466 RepID=UPI00257B92BA|nr:hypothetical protein [Sellimonas sp.]
MEMITAEEVKQLIVEVRQEFQIPPYFPDASLENYIKEGYVRLMKLNPVAKLESDLDFRMLLKNYTYYAYHHKVNEWENNYASLILSWQLGSEVDIDADA